MAWGQPKRNGKCPTCGQRGRCSCQRRANAVLASAPRGDNGTCTAQCGWNGRGAACNRNKRSGVCPCPNC